MKVNCDSEGIEKTSQIIEKGGIAIFPTDTVYGIGCNPYNQNAVKKIASLCDIFFVIGAQNSSNSIRLVEVAKQYGAKKAILLESIENFYKQMRFRLTVIVIISHIGILITN